jgi:hypothetical protein
VKARSLARLLCWLGFHEVPPAPKAGAIIRCPVCRSILHFAEGHWVQLGNGSTLKTAWKRWKS